MSDLFYKTLLADLSSSLAMQPLSFSAQGTCDLIIDESIALKLMCDGVNHRLLLIGMLDVAPDVSPQHLLGGALNPLLTGGPGIGWDEASELYLAYQTIPREKISVAVLTVEIAKLVEWIKQWRGNTV